MKKAALYITLMFLFGTYPLLSQHTHTVRCHADERMDILSRQDPDYARVLEEPVQVNPNRNKMMDVITIPVHVIIVHPPGQAVGTGVNFNMDHIQSQIDVLNEDFRRLNDDATNTPPEFAAGDSEIEFCLASIDPNGNPTDGVTRYGTTQNLNANEFEIKSATGWDRNNYMNFWVGPNLGGILGWAYLPTLAGLPNATLDGIVVVSGAFGGPGYGTTNNYDLGRTATHEVGHYLGLRHIWRNGGCGLDDGFADTPLQDDQNFGCPNHPSPSCGNNGDMFMNYMDYVNDDCMNAFSVEQGLYMQDILNTSRSSLLTAAATYCSNVNDPLTLDLIDAVDVLCFGEANGIITVEASGGSGGYTYSLDGGPFQNSGTFIDVAAGAHVVTAMDSNGETIDLDVVINEPAELFLNIDNQLNVSCFGYTDGIVVVTGNGGTPGPGNIYNYSIDGGAYSPVNLFDNLSAGPHFVSVQDNNGCETTIDVFIVEPPELISLTEQLVNVTCNGENDGFVTLVTTGGTPFYMYSIDGVVFQSNPSFPDLSPGDYQVMTIDENNCMTETLFSITEPDILALSITDEVNPLCANEETGSLIVEATGGTQSYQYSVDGVNYQDSPIFESLSAGTYTASVLDANNCLNELSVELTEPDVLVLEVITQTEAGCAGQAEGTVTVTASGGSGENIFIYESQNLTGDTVTFENLPEGTLTISVSDLNACTDETEVEITAAAAIELETVNITDVSCFGDANGSVTVQGTGGSGIYFYNIDGGGYTEVNIFENLAPGFYDVGVQDETGCEGTAMIEITGPDEIIGSIDNLDNVVCSGESNGSINVSAEGGAGDFEYTLLSQSNSTGVFESLDAGIFEVIVTDANGCTSPIAFEIEEPAPIELEEVVNQSVDCFGNGNGSVTVNATGGNNVFEYNLNGEINNNGDFTNLDGGTYEVLATDENGCTQVLEITIDEPQELEATIDNVVNVSCAGDASGAIQVVTTGGSGVVTYTLNSVSNETGLFVDLIEGSYTIEVQDDNDCSTTISADVASADELEVVEESLDDVSCFGLEDGAVQLVVSGGNGDFEFEVNGQTNNSGLFEDLPAGSYEAIVTDGAACSGTYAFEIIEPDVLEIGIENQNDVSCFGAMDGSIQVVGLGGTGAYTYNDGNATNMDGLFENLSGGTVELTITDEAGCNALLIVEIQTPDEISVELTDAQDAACGGGDDGSFTVQATGGNGTFEYTLNGETNSTGLFENLIADVYTVEAIDLNGCTQSLDVEIASSAGIELSVDNQDENNCFGDTNASIQINANGGTGDLVYEVNGQTNATGFFDNLPAGVYNAIVTDDAACAESYEFEITQPDLLEIEVETQNNVSCFGAMDGNLQLTGLGGTGVYIFSDGNTTNENGLFENLSDGTLQITVNDEAGCTTTLTIEITTPDEIVVELTANQDAACGGGTDGSFTVLANGGAGDFEYTTNGENNNTGVFENLAANVYTVEVTDNNGCTSTLDVEVSEAADIELSVETLNENNCFGNAEASIQIVATGGGGGFEYELDGVSNNTGIFENLAAGEYVVSVTDANGCVSTMLQTVDQPVEILVDDLVTVQATCFGDNDGLVMVTAQGGTGVFQYTLNGQINNTGEFESLGAGSYELQIIDENNCTVSQSITITQPDVVESVVVENSGATCFGSNDGWIQLQGQGGSGTYTYSLDNQTNDNGLFENLPSGSYELIVIDENNCQSAVEVEVTDPAAIMFTQFEIQNIACGNTTELGAIQVLADGGVGSFIYTLGGQSNSTGLFENLPAASYEIMVTDANDCFETQPFDIVEGAELELDVQTTQEISCNGETDGIVQVTAQGASNLTYTLNGQSNSTGLFENLPAGDYNVIVTDQDGCSSSLIYELQQPDEIVIENLITTEISCNGMNDAVLQVQVTGGAGAYMYTLNSLQNDDGTFDDLEAGNYELIITDDNGCTISTSVTIDQPDAVEVFLIQNESVTCYGADDGMIQVEGLGGNGMYTYTLGLETNATGTFLNLPGGVYNVLAVDENDCSSSLTITIEQPDQLEAEIASIESIGCTGNLTGSVTLAYDGGNGVITYALGNEINTNGYFDNLDAGNYTAQLTDENNCTTSIDFEIIESGEVDAEVIDQTNVSCFGDSDGFVVLQVVGGNTGYTYEVNGEINEIGVFTNLPAGAYEAIVSNGNGCETTVEFTINQPQAINADAFELQALSCFDSEDALIQLEAFGGAGLPYTYTLGTQSNQTGVFENLPSGSFEVVIADQNNCTSSVSFTIIAPDAIQTNTLQNVEPVCYGESGGLIEVAANGGTGPYNYEMNGQSNTDGLFETLTAGTYQLLVTDDNGCTNTETLLLSQPPVLISGVLNIDNLLCNGDDDAVIYIGADGGTPGYEFELDGEVNSGGVFFGLSSGSYIVNVTDANGCLSQTTVVVAEPESVQPQIESTQDDTGTANGRVDLSVTGGVGPYTYSLDGINFTPFPYFENLSVGTYTAYVQDAYGCLGQIEFVIEMGTFIIDPDSGVESFDVFPNPFSNELIIDLTLTEALDLDFVLYNVVGQQVFYTNENILPGTSQLRLDIPEHLPAATYILKLSNENAHIGYFKLIKQ